MSIKRCHCARRAVYRVAPGTPTTRSHIDFSVSVGIYSAQPVRSYNCPSYGYRGQKHVDCRTIPKFTMMTPVSHRNLCLKLSELLLCIRPALYLHWQTFSKWILATSPQSASRNASHQTPVPRSVARYLARASPTRFTSIEVCLIPNQFDKCCRVGVTCWS